MAGELTPTTIVHNGRNVTIDVPAFRVELPVNELQPQATARITHPDLGTCVIRQPVAMNSNDPEWTPEFEQQIVASIRVKYCEMVADRLAKR